MVRENNLYHFKIIKIGVQGRVLTEVNARLSSATLATLRAAESNLVGEPFLHLYIFI